MKAERIFKFSFIGIFKKYCTEFDIQFYRVENLPNDLMKFYFDEDRVQLTAFFAEVDADYKHFLKINS